MTARKKGALDLPGLGFDEALARLIQTDPKELTDDFERTKRESDDIKRSVDERRTRLRAATAGPRKKFSL